MPDASGCALYLGLDEAGYGPTLGPLAVAAVAARTSDPAALAAALAALGVADSKRVHTAGDLAAIERVALPAAGWFAGLAPRTAADLFALLGEPPDERAPAPWMAGADALVLPVCADAAPWVLPMAAPAGLRGRLLHPRHLNAARRSGINRADAELHAVAGLIAGLIPSPDAPAAAACDRLGGRRHYATALARIWPGRDVAVVAEEAAESRYRCGGTTIAFLVGGDGRDALIAAASCIAKYARELHMLLFNRWWCGRHPWLKPTAGYPEDAKRWLHQVGEGQTAAWLDELVRSRSP